MKSAKNYRLGIPAFTTKNSKSSDSTQRIYGHRKRPEIALREERALAGVMRNWNKNWKNSKSLGSAPREFHVCIADMKLLCEKWHW